jgi:hypothetical protein
MHTSAVARHMLTAAEFAEEMAISPQFYAARYPQESAGGAVFHLGYTLVDPDRATLRTFPAMMQVVAERMTRERGVCVFDGCAYNDGRSVGRMWDRVARRGVARVESLDTQTYYAASFTEVTETGSVE